MEETTTERPRGIAVLVAGSTALIAGSYLPWLRTNPTYSYVNAIHISGMDSGVQLLDYPLLGAAGVVLLTALVIERPALRAVASLFAAGVTGFFCVRYLGAPDDTVGFGSMFIPDIGWYVSVFGGVLLLVAGGAYVLTALWAEEAPSPRTE